VITPVAIDHTRWLGHTVAEIAHQKAGIIKSGSIAVVAEQQPDAEHEIAARVAEADAQVWWEGEELGVVGRELAVGGQLLDLRTHAGLYTGIYLPLYGEHQAHNALLALAATEALLTGGDHTLGAGVVEAGFAAADSPGRLEVLRSSPTILVDAAHNPAGAAALVAGLGESFDFPHLVGVLAVMADKDVEGVLSELEPVLSEVVVTRNSSPRAMAIEDLAELAAEVFGEDRVHTVGQLDEAIQVAVNLAEAADEVGVGVGTGVLVTGSVVTVADARVLLGRG
jgi:dihydrofolate synthase/folylpolyglutamate synthase